MSSKNPHKLIFSHYEFDDYNSKIQEDIQSYLSYLNISNCLITLECSENRQILKDKNNVPSKEYYYDAEYHFENIPETDLKFFSENLWTSESSRSNLFLPSPNIYICDNFDLLKFWYDLEALSENSESEKLSNFHSDFFKSSYDSSKFYNRPKLLVNNLGQQVFFKQDNSTFNTPKYEINVIIFTQNLPYTMENAFYTRILSRLIKDEMEEVFYDAGISGFSFSCNLNFNSIGINCYGYTQKLFILFKNLLEFLQNFQVKPARLPVIVDLVTRKFKNKEHNQPYQLAREALQVIKNDKVLDMWKQLEFLENQSEFFENLCSSSQFLQEFYENAFRSASYKVLIAGNCDEAQAKQVVNSLDEFLLNSKQAVFFDYDKMFSDNYFNREIVKYGGQRSVVKYSKTQPTSSVVVEYLMGDRSLKNRAVSTIFNKIFSAQCFGYLRTKLQLGYIVHGMDLSTLFATGSTIIIQSNKHPLYCHYKINLFWTTIFKDYLNNFTESDLEKTCSAYIQKLTEPAKNLRSDVAEVQAPIYNDTLNFEFNQELALEIEKVSLSDMQNYFENVILNNSNVLASYVIGTELKDSEYGMENLKKDLVAEIESENEVAESEQMESLLENLALYSRLEDLKSLVYAEKAEFFPRREIHETAKKFYGF